MSRKKTRLQYRRKRNGKTNYKKRLNLLKSQKDRLVIRKTNKYVIGQIIRYKPEGDQVLLTVNSQELTKMGWKASCKNIPASYMTGLILGMKAKEKNIKEAILDLGLQTPLKKSRIYAVLKGVIDGEVKIPSSEDIFPNEDRLNAKHLSEKVQKDFETIKSKLMK